MRASKLIQKSHCVRRAAIINFLAYLLIISKITQFIRIQYSIIIVNELIGFLLLLFQAAQVPLKMEKLQKLICQYLVYGQKTMSLTNRIKVS